MPRNINFFDNSHPSHLTQLVPSHIAIKLLVETDYPSKDMQIIAVVPSKAMKSDQTEPIFQNPHQIGPNLGVAFKKEIRIKYQTKLEKLTHQISLF